MKAKITSCIQLDGGMFMEGDIVIMTFGKRNVTHTVRGAISTINGEEGYVTIDCSKEFKADTTRVYVEEIRTITREVDKLEGDDRSIDTSDTIDW